MALARQVPGGPVTGPGEPESGDALRRQALGAFLRSRR